MNKQMKVFKIVVEMGMMIMSLMSQVKMDHRTERMSLDVLSMMQSRVCALLGLSTTQVEEIWREAKCGMRDMMESMTPEEASELADRMSKDEEKARA